MGERMKVSAAGMAQSQTSQSPWPTCARFELPLPGGQVGTWNSHTAPQQDGTQPPAPEVKAMLEILTGHIRGQEFPKALPPPAHPLLHSSMARAPCALQPRTGFGQAGLVELKLGLTPALNLREGNCNPVPGKSGSRASAQG